LNYEQEEDLVCITYTFGAAELKLELITLKKQNLILKPSLLILLATLSIPEAIGFTLLVIQLG
jgi:hypothetical protein